MLFCSSVTSFNLHIPVVLPASVIISSQSIRSLHPIKLFSYLETPLHLKTSLLKYQLMFLENEDAEECLSGTLDVAANSVVYLKCIYIYLGGPFS